jgi:hypothetical protein
LRDELSLDCVSLDLAKVDQSRPIAHVMSEFLEVPTVEVGSVGDFASHPRLADQVVVLDGLDKRALRRWGLFLRHLLLEDPGDTIVGPIIVVLVPVGLTHEEAAELCGSATVLLYQGTIDRYDTASYVAGIGLRPGDELVSRVGHSTVLEVAAWSRDLLERMMTWQGADQIDPIALLQRTADTMPFPFPNWENGLVDLWDDEPAAHAAAAIKFGLREHVQRRIWAAQANVLLPFTHRILRSLVLRYRDVLDRMVSPSTPYIKRYNDRVLTITDPTKLEFHDFREFTKTLLSSAELELIKIAGWCRNAVAHRDIIPPAKIELFSDHYENSREMLESDIPGWNWPRCGQTMIMAGGPSGAEKTT